jgi:hypothetical protein
MHRAATLAILTLAASLASCATAPPPVAHDDPHPGSVQVKANHCDDRGGVDALLLQVEGPGTVTIRWSNKGVCGDSV